MQRSRAALLLLFLPVLLLTCLAGPAHAVPAPPQLAGIELLDQTELELHSVTIDFDCRRKAPFALACRVTSRYAISNPTQKPATAWLRVPTGGSYRASVDGAPVADDGRIELTVPAGDQRTVQVVCRENLEPYYFNMALLFDAMVVRHPLLGQHSRPDWPRPIRTQDMETRGWARVGQTTVTARYPTSWSELEGWTRSDRGKRRVATITAPVGQPVQFDPDKLPQVIHFANGGPYVELGGTFDVGFRARVGYEVSWRSWLLTTLAVGTDFSDDLVIAPVVEVASPNLFLIPSIGLGIGAPVRVLPDTSVGVRLQLVAAFPIGFVTTFDYWPEDDLWRTTLSARIGI